MAPGTQTYFTFHTYSLMLGQINLKARDRIRFITAFSYLKINHSRICFQPYSTSVQRRNHLVPGKVPQGSALGCSMQARTSFLMQPHSQKEALVLLLIHISEVCIKKQVWAETRRFSAQDLCLENTQESLSSVHCMINLVMKYYVGIRGRENLSWLQDCIK